MEHTSPQFPFHQFTTPEKQPQRQLSDFKPSDHFAIDDLLNFPTDDTTDVTDHTSYHDHDHDHVLVHVHPGGDNVTNNNNGPTTDSNDSSIVSATAVDTGNSDQPAARRSLTDAQFSHDLCVPYDDVAELEWLSNFVEDSFSTEDMEKLQLISGVKPRVNTDRYETNKYQHNSESNRTINPKFNTDMTVQSKARTKRSRAAPCSWTSRLITPTQQSAGPIVTVSSESESDIGSSSIGKKAPMRKKEVYDNESHNGEGRKCLHCATDKTPQWRTGPLGPKTLCNACGVRYKSGRLVPEYRPAASPTFVLTKHSNSHRKVLELRRQKEMQGAHQQTFFHHHHHHHQNVMFDVSKGDDYLIHQHIGLDYRQLI